MTTRPVSADTFIDLSPDAVHVWHARLSMPPLSVAALWDILADAERVAAGQFALPRDQRAFVLRRGLLRMLLARYRGVPPATLQFAMESQGKLILVPMARQPAIAFNFSQSGDLVLYAVARQSVGVDVEDATAEHDVAALVEMFFTPAEHAWLAAIPSDRYVTQALRLWTCKESYAKATGAGLTAALGQMNMVRDGGLANRLGDTADATTGRCWSLRAFEPISGYVAAVTYQWSGKADFALHMHPLADDEAYSWQ